MTHNALGEQFSVLFHGTSRTFAAGDMILPAQVHGQGTATGAPHGDYAFATTDQGQARNFSRMAASTLGGRPTVYRVEAVGDVENDPAYGEDQSSAKRSSQGFRVLGEVKRRGLFRR